MKRFFLRALLAALLCLFSLHAAADNAATKVEMYCTVNADGDCLVSMNVNLHLDGSDSGLVFPLPKEATGITLNGSSAPCSSDAKSTLVGLGKTIGGMTGDFPLRFDFTIPKAVKAYTVQKTLVRQLELRIPMLRGFDYPINAFSFIVTLPANITTVPSFTSSYQQTGFESNLDIVVNGNMITGASKSGLRDHEEVSLRLVVPQSMFPSVSIYQREGNPEVIPMGIFVGLALLYWIFFLRTLPPIRQRAAVPPEGISAGELGCRITMTGGDLSLMVMSWAQMGYLLIQEDERGRILLHKRMDMGNERSLFEIRIFQSLFGKRRAVDAGSIAYAKLCQKTAAMVPGEKTMCRPKSGSRVIFRLLLCISQLFCGICIAMNMTSVGILQVMFSIIFGILSAISAWYIHEFAFVIRNRYKLKAWIALALCAFWILMGLIAGQPWIPMAAVFVQLLMGYFAAYGGMRTDLNRSNAGEILGVRRFLQGIPRPEAARLLKSDPEYFFRMAPYAIALGVGKPFAAAFGRRKLEPCPYFIARGRNRKTASEWMELMTRSIQKMDNRYRRIQLEKWLAIRFR